MGTTTSMALAAGQEILGYTLRHRLGSGGYGEVWVAEAPGGLPKAIKFIFGYHDEERAQRELKSLGRIRDLRHPFLLSLERIDVIDGRMVVITELADRSLKNCFEECLAKGLKGIPRDELLGFLRDAADGLDYLSQAHQLQHLDVKPDNLLLVGSHVKIADFGLVKNIYDVNQSMMDGLTPAYASPEVFDGRPGLASDQYSLAVVYQEMVTGQRPFDGTTAAQLAAQHLHARPSLDGLPRGDQIVLSRALAKDPEKRYPNCVAFISDLKRRRSRAIVEVRRRNVRGENVDTNVTQTYVPTPGGVTPHLESGTTSERTERPEAQIDRRPRLDLTGVTASVRPMLFVGVGKTGTAVLSRLRRRLVDQFGNAEAWPAFRFLCLDTDRKSLFGAATGSPSGALCEHETMCLPLRRPEEYRQRAGLDLAWLSRRWIYNVPRSLQTEGLRPMGRLAFVDHARAVLQRLRDELEKVSVSEALAQTADTMGLLPGLATPQVVLVTSVAGGVGSGMSVDLIYAVRTLLSEMGMPDEDVVGLFLHSTPRASTDDRLAVTNSYSFLRELHHYWIHGYPGDRASGIPKFDDPGPCIGQCYLWHMGDKLSDPDYDRAVSNVAEYLLLSTASPANAFFTASRRVEPTNEDEVCLRTIGFASRGIAPADVTRTGSQLVAKLLGRWLEGGDWAYLDATTLVTNTLNQAGLRQELIEQQFMKGAEEKLGQSPLDYLHSALISQLRGMTNIEPVLAWSQAVDKLDSLIGELQADPNRAGTSLLGQTSAAKVVDLSPLATHCARQLGELWQSLVDGQAGCLAATRHMLEEIIAGLRRLDASIAAAADQAEKRWAVASRNPWAAETDRIAQTVATPTPGQWIELTRELVNTRWKVAVTSAVRRVVGQVRWQIDEQRQQLDAGLWALRTAQQTLAQFVEQSRGEAPSESIGFDLGGLMQASLNRESATLLDQLGIQVEHDLINPQGGLLALMNQPPASWLSKIQSAAERIVYAALTSMSFEQLIAEGGIDGQTLGRWIDVLMRDAKPGLTECGGATQLLLAVPRRATAQDIGRYIEAQFNEQATMVPATAGEMVLCYDVSQVSMENVGLLLLEPQTDCAELISRLNTRCDVNWTSLTQLC